MSGERWPRVAVVGAGAVGCYFGGRLARAGAPVTLIGRPGLVAAIRAEGGLFLDAIAFQERVAVTATTEPSAVAGAEFVLLAVKTLDTVEAARGLAPYLAPGAIVVSLQNGVDNADRIKAAIGLDVVPAVVYVAARMSGPARVKQAGRGDLAIGDRGAVFAKDRLRDLAGAFERAGVGCRVSPDIEGELWIKLVMNAAYNAMSALGPATYGALAADPGALEVMRSIVDETVAVAAKLDIDLPGDELRAGIHELGTAMPGAISSTAQDLERGKRTEIDSLNGYVATKGAELGVPTPANRVLTALVKLREARFG